MPLMRLVGRWLLRGINGLALIVCLASCSLLAWSYCIPLTTPPAGPRLPLPLPGDAAEYLVLSHGRIAQWEYTDWDRTWYRLGPGVRLWPITLASVAATIGAALWVARQPAEPRGNSDD
jgi:hypothetical protein